MGQNDHGQLGLGSRSEKVSYCLALWLAFAKSKLAAWIKMLEIND